MRRKTEVGLPLYVVKIDYYICKWSHMVTGRVCDCYRRCINLKRPLRTKNHEYPFSQGV